MRPEADWIGVAPQRLGRNKQWATRNTRGEHLLRCLVSCRRCGCAHMHMVYNNGRDAYHRGRGMDTLIMRQWLEACHARQVDTARLDRQVKRRTDVVGIFPKPATLVRLVGAALGEQHDGQRVARRSFSAESLAKLGKEEAPLPELIDPGGVVAV